MIQMAVDGRHIYHCRSLKERVKSCRRAAIHLDGVEVEGVFLYLVFVALREFCQRQEQKYFNTLIRSKKKH